MNQLPDAVVASRPTATVGCYTVPDSDPVLELRSIAEDAGGCGALTAISATPTMARAGWPRWADAYSVGM